MRGAPLIAAGVAAASLALGAATFPNAFEPGRTESDGPLTALVDGGRLHPQNWVPNLTGGTVRPVGVSLLVNANGGGLVLLSRTLPVFPRTCYRLQVVAAARGPGLTVVVRDERARKTITTLAVPLGPTARPAALELGTGRQRRLTLGLTSDRAARALVRSVTLQRTSAPCARP